MTYEIDGLIVEMKSKIVGLTRQSEVYRSSGEPDKKGFLAFEKENRSIDRKLSV